MNNKEKAVRHLLKFTSLHSWWAAEFVQTERIYDWNKGYIDVNYKEVANGACYAGINLAPSQYNWIALGYRCDKGDSAGKNFLAWVLGDESPWRSLFKDDFELIQSDTHIRGFFIPRKTLEKADYKFLKNFMIATRAFNEFEDHIRLWDYLVQNGIPKDRAFYYSNCVMLDEGKPYIKYVPNSNHWAWDSPTVDFKRIQESKPNLTIDRTNKIWDGLGKGSIIGYIQKVTGSNSKQLTLEAMLNVDKEFTNANFKLS